MSSDLHHANFILSNVELTFEDPVGGRLSGDGNYSKNSIVVINAFPERLHI